MSDKTIVWVHGDNLNPYGPALQAHPDAPALFVFDEALLASWRISLKRLLFMYECLLELPVVIRRGDLVAEIVAFAQAHGVTAVATAPSPSPRFAAICRRLEAAGLTVTIHEAPPFLTHEPHFDLKRFSRYWRQAQKYAFEETTG